MHTGARNAPERTTRGARGIRGEGAKARGATPSPGKVLSSRPGRKGEPREAQRALRVSTSRRARDIVTERPNFLEIFG